MGSTQIIYFGVYAQDKKATTCELPVSVSVITHDQNRFCISKLIVVHMVILVNNR